MATINREKSLLQIHNLFKNHPIVAILGARQTGKTTLAKMLHPNHHFDLENPRDLAKLEQAQTTLEDLEGLIVIDEVQRRPDLFPLLRFLVDQNKKQKFLILGSASRDLLQQSSESLAGRIAYHYLSGLNTQELPQTISWKKRWERGGFPRSLLASSDQQSINWRENYIRTFLERDIPQLGISIPSQTLRRFWTMLSHYHGQIVNFSEIAKSFGISDKTVRNYIDILNGTFMTQTLQPWHNNTKKRLVKSPKLYLRDSGLFHSLQTIQSLDQLLSHPKLGASWEGFCIEQVIQILQLNENACYFWKVHQGPEVDLFWQHGGKNYGIEVKYQDAPSFSKSMQIAIKELNLERLIVLYPGKDSYKIHKDVSVFPIQDLNPDKIYT